MDEPEQPVPSYPPPAPGRPPGRPWTMAAFAFAAIGFLVNPILGGPAGILCGIIGARKGDPRGRTAAIAAGVLAVISMALYLLLRDS